MILGVHWKGRCGSAARKGRIVVEVSAVAGMMEAHSGVQWRRGQGAGGVGGESDGMEEAPKRGEAGEGAERGELDGGGGVCNDGGEPAAVAARSGVGTVVD